MTLRNTNWCVEITMTHEEARKLTAELCAEEFSFPIMGPLKDESKIMTRVLDCLLTGKEDY